MRKLLAIIWKENYIRFTDRNGAIFMFAAPLALSIVIGLAFSGLTGNGDVPSLNVPVGIVNEDTGTAQFNFGDVFVQAMIPEDAANPAPDNALQGLLDAREIDTVEEARALVESGDLTAALFIPGDFSQSIAIDPASFASGAESDSGTQAQSATLHIYYNSGSQIGWTVFRDVVQEISNSIATTNIAISTMIKGVGLPGMLSINFVQEQAAQPDANPIHLDQVTVKGEEAKLDMFAFFAPGIAIFFTSFAVMIGSISILQEQHDWTLQRMVTTPTSRTIILAGKMLGTWVGGVMQLLVLIVSITAIASILKGEFSNVWGTSVPGILLLTLVISAAGTGVGAILAGFARTFEQAANLGSVVLIVMGLMAGTFFSIEGLPNFLQFFSRLTFNYWGKSGFETLSQGGTFVDILPQTGALLLIAVVTFGIGVWLFRRRLDL